ncbi:MAG: VOC family protein [Candidatus Kerfeldbacteria bacterium]|nr:VOC family protein [Candidatus Kerfeldbacteria bacterium]
MLSAAPVSPTIPVVDMERARAFYTDKLGLTMTETDATGGVMLQAGEGTKIYLYKRESSKADHTLAGFLVADIEEEVADLVAKGVEFMEYDQEPIRTENFIATIDGQKAAWFKDSEGNILGLTQRG